MAKEKFKKEDIKSYEEEDRYHTCNRKQRDLVDVKYLSEEVKHIKLPTKFFTHLIEHDRDYLTKYLPYNIKISKLNREGNDWLKESNYLGLNEGEDLILCLDSNHNHSVLSLLWVMLHEFRHKIQHLNNSINSVIRNQNTDKWLDNYRKDINLLNHVFHEILPFEVDANVFACEILNIEYPGSKFEITDKTLEMLK